MNSDSLSPSLSKLLSAPPNIQPIKVEESIPNQLNEASAEPSELPPAAALPSASSPLLPTLLPLPLLLNLTNSASAFDPTTLYLQSLLLGEFIKQQTENCNVILNTLQAESMVSSPSASVQPSPTEVPKNSPSFPLKAEKSRTDKAKNYPCIVCVVCKEKICARSRRLHIEAHFSYQPHSCSVCGFAARKSIIVQLHVNKMHRGNGQVITKVDEKVEAELVKRTELQSEISVNFRIRPLKSRNPSVSSSTVFEKKW
ncbi:hypothetical protein WR25_06730 [Diploscapter pachys]|uniref:C2H2-type domain-containing protein n=1 Tax=Diploscapter pachys TaxID=2018661 RepID=A0A2A2KWI7_9BILA|nr:hypothetical protein WR25_06730 [Diploscapter pachys]